MTAMMLPSAIPFVVSFGRSVAHDRLWSIAVAVLAAVYLAVWMAFGAALLAVAAWIPVWAAVAIAAVYMLTPLQRFGEDRCVALCRRFDAGRAGALRAAVVRGSRYGLFCVACTAGAMLVICVLGMADVRFMAVGSVVAVVLKARTWPAIA